MKGQGRYTWYVVDLGNLLDGGDAAEMWARANCPTFVQVDRFDLSDLSNTQFDTVASFMFGSEKDSILFKLMWMGEK